MAACGLLLLCAIGRAGAEQTGELLGLRFDGVYFESHMKIDEEGLRNLLPLRLGAPLTNEDLAEARRRLELKGIFRDIELEPRREGDGVTVLVRLRRKRVVNKVRATGHSQLRSAEMQRLIRLRTGMIFEPELLEAARDRILQRYERMGFVHARVDTDVERRDGEVDVIFRVTEGDPLLVKTVVVEGDMALPRSELEATVAELVDEPHAHDFGRKGERMLVRHLRKEGYYEARVSSRWETTSETQGVLYFDINAGPRFEIEIRGNESKGRGRLLGLMDVLDRLIVTDGTWRELARRMVREYQESGFYHAAVNLNVEDGDPKRALFKVSEGRRYRIHSVDFEGNSQIRDQQLRDEMSTQARRLFPWPRGGVLIDDGFDEDLRRLSFFYREQGFESAEIVDAERNFDPERGTIDITVVIEEGPRTIVREIRPEDVSALAGGELGLKVQVGRPLNPDHLKEDRRTILAAFSGAGYAQAQAEATVERHPDGEQIAAVVNWRVRAGPRQEIGAIIVEGNVDTRDQAIRRELPFSEGDPLDTGALLKGQGEVYRLGLFRTVSVRPITPEEETIRDVGVEVAERPPGSFHWGAGYNTRDGFGSFAEVAYGNLAGMARRISARGQFSLEPTDFVPNQYLVNLGYRDPRLRGSFWRLNSNLIGERSTRSVDQFSVKRISLVNGVDRELLAHLQGGIEWQTELSDVFDVEEDAELISEDEGSLRTIALSPFLVYDRRDDAFAPRSGFFDSIRLRYALPEISSVHFAKLSLQHSQYVPLAEQVTFLYAARVGWARSLGNELSVPIRERFFLGGRTTVRGFAENSIGPRGENGHEIGGDLALNVNLELQVPLVYGFGAAVFFDGGGLYLQKCDSECRDERSIRDAAISLDNFRRAAGFGLRYLTPVGPISLDYGIKLDRRSGESFGELHFSIGSSF